MEFKDKLKILRTEAGLSQEALGGAVHISRSAIAKYENGNGKPSVDTLKALAMYFGVSEGELKGDEEIAIEAKVAKRKKIIKWSLISFGIVAGASAIAVLVLFLTIPWRSHNGPAEEPLSPSKAVSLNAFVYHVEPEGMKQVKPRAEDPSGAIRANYTLLQGEEYYILVMPTYQPVNGYFIARQDDFASFLASPLYTVSFHDSRYPTGSFYVIRFDSDKIAAVTEDVIVTTYVDSLFYTMGFSFSDEPLIFL